MATCFAADERGTATHGAAPLASTLAVGGQVIYFWLRAFVGHYHEGGMDPPPYAPFAIVRYVALGLLVQELRGLTA